MHRLVRDFSHDDKADQRRSLPVYPFGIAEANDAFRLAVGIQASFVGAAIIRR